jgi:hypothetical protein
MDITDIDGDVVRVEEFESDPTVCAWLRTSDAGDVVAQ